MQTNFILYEDSTMRRWQAPRSTDKVKRPENVASDWEFDGNKNAERWGFG